METLASLVNFANKYPQTIGGELQYLFLGGTGVRLNQMSVDSESVRPITDIDLLVLGNNKYPVHQCTPEDVFGAISIDRTELSDYIKSVKIGNQNYSFVDGTFLTLTKTCAMDNPRTKDYEDIVSLYELDLIDFDKLKDLYFDAPRVNNNSELIVNNLKWFLDENKNKSSNRASLFCSFPRLVNFLSEFENPIEIRDLLVEFSEEYKSDGMAISSVVYNVHNVVREFDKCDEEKKKNIVETLLTEAGVHDYRDFDEMVNFGILPKIRYSKSLEDRLSVVKSLI